MSHSAGSIIELCNRAVLLDHGEVLLTGCPKTVVSRYHKLLYAPAEKAAAIRAEILRCGESEMPSDAEEKPEPGEPPRPADISRAYLDPHLRPKSTVRYESAGAEICDYRITTPAGRPVNVLVPHEEYVIRYRVNFTRPSFQVRWGTMIKNLVGTELSGTAAPHILQPARDYVPAGTVVDAAFRFRLDLLPGVYFANVGLMGVVDSQVKYLHRLEDAMIFRVIDGPIGSHGIFDMFVKAEVAQAEVVPAEVVAKEAA